MLHSIYTISSIDPARFPPIWAVCRPTYPSYTSRHVSLALAPAFSLLLAQSTTSSLVLCGALNGRKILLHFCTIWMKWIDRIECLVCLPLWMYVPFDSPRYLRCVSLWIHIVIRWDSSASADVETYPTINKGMENKFQTSHIIVILYRYISWWISDTWCLLLFV